MSNTADVTGGKPSIPGVNVINPLVAFNDNKNNAFCKNMHIKELAISTIRIIIANRDK
jgi:hypothetical protein